MTAPKRLYWSMVPDDAQGRGGVNVGRCGAAVSMSDVYAAAAEAERKEGGT